MFSVGDKVMHCAHGAGVITEKKEMQITDTPHYYLVIQMLSSNSTLMIPTDRAKESLRPVSERTTLRRLLTSELAGEPEELSGDYKERQKHLIDKLKSGETIEWIEIVRDLTFQSEQGHLSLGDRKLLDRAMGLLSGELALAQGVPLEEAEPRLKSMVERRHELADHQSESSSWWRTLGQKEREPFVRSSVGSGEARMTTKGGEPYHAQDQNPQSDGQTLQSDRQAKAAPDETVTQSPASQEIKAGSPLL